MAGVAIRLVIYGEPASKANSRQIVMLGSRPAVIKSQKALAYERDARKQISGDKRLMIDGPVRVTLRIWYASERPDLDESVLLDVLQARMKAGVVIERGVYRNDRQVREKHVYHAIDRGNPRAEILVEPLRLQQGTLL